MQKHHLINSFTSIRQQLRIRLILALSLSFALSSVGNAQTADDVTLRFANGQDSISGTLTDFKDGKFFMQASIGLVVIPTDGVFCVGDACPEETRLQVADAQIVLTSKTGNVTMTGDLIEIENDEYVLATAFGVQRIAAGLVNCEGAACVSVPANLPVDNTVELTNGGITLKGILMGFQDDSYILKDEVMGEIRVKATQFQCSGAGCP